jgi:uncharacterized membrane protein YedE/YeeE
MGRADPFPPICLSFLPLSRILLSFFGMTLADYETVFAEEDAPMSVLKQKSWSPYLVGAAIGILSWFAFASADHPLGITTAFENTAALLIQSGNPDANSVQTLAQARESSPKIDWEWMLVLGVFIGAFLSSSLSGDRSHSPVPDLWARRFGTSRSKRMLAAFAGGALMMFGARLAQGCTSGHSISGIAQLAISSLVFTLIFFAVGIVTAQLIYRRASRHV